jgi:uncharacterized SAM-binding protein YcdF (DUF218 family)
MVSVLGSHDAADSAGDMRGRSRPRWWWTVPGLLAVFAALVIAGHALPDAAPCGPADAAVVLAGAGAYLERTGEAARLYHAGLVPRIVLTDDGLRGGWSAERQRNPSFAEWAVIYLESLAVPPERLEVLEGVVQSTHDEAVLLRRWVEEEGVGSLQVVSSWYHVRRARWTLRRVLGESAAGVRVCAARVAGEPRPGSWWRSAPGWRVVGGELVKMAWYRIRY